MLYQEYKSKIYAFEIYTYTNTGVNEGKAKNTIIEMT